ncbi:hypothetical protein [Shimia sp. SDUM112013]|uniref:hypothetical protein n=1 Tax=Shimia sp. SDUM112013 TaxID=3136160 RepID=UPI0032ED1A58
MTRKHGLYRSDGQPARQYGEEIIEPGEAFNEDTLSVIRDLVDETAQPADPPASEPHEGLSQSGPTIATRAVDAAAETEGQTPPEQRECVVSGAPALKPLLHFSEKKPDDGHKVPTDWVRKMHEASDRHTQGCLVWQVDLYARGAALLMLVGVALWVF